MTGFSALFVRKLARNSFPFKFRLFLTLRKIGILNGTIDYNTEFGSFSVPADQWQFWKINDPKNYGRRRLDYLAELVKERYSSCHFVDLGADIGAISLGLFSRLSEFINQITAVEPNPKSFAILKGNLGALPVETRLYNKAVGGENCWVELVYDQSKSSDHSGYVNRDSSGNTEMVTLDALLGQNHADSVDGLLLKIDVEGQEKPVLQGGKQAILSYKKVIIFLEVMPKVLERENSSAEELFETAEQIRSFDWIISDHPYTKVDRNIPFKEQFGADKQRDVIGISVD